MAHSRPSPSLQFQASALLRARIRWVGGCRCRRAMERLEAEIRRVLQDHHRISSTVGTEEAKIDDLSKEIRSLDDRLRSSDWDALDRQRLQNLLSYQSTLIDRAASRTDLLRALHNDLLVLFTQRKQLRQSDGAAGVASVVVLPNISISSGLSCGDDENRVFPNDCPMPGPMDVLGLNGDRENMEEVTTETEPLLPLGLKIFQINMNEDACLTPEDKGEFEDLQFKANILDNIALTILDPSDSVDSIFKEAIETSNFSSAENTDSIKVPMEVDRDCSLATRSCVDFDELGNPAGPNAGAFKRSINSHVCHFLPVRFKQIGDVPIEDYKSVLNILTERYNFDLNRSYTRKKISSCYRQHKYKLLVQVKKDLESGLEPRKPSYVKQDDWHAFVARTKDEEFDRISKKNKASRSQQSSINRKVLSQIATHKGKLEGSEQGPLDQCMGPKLHKTKQDRPRKQSSIKDNNLSVIDGVDVNADCGTAD